jgi:tripartite-type tricarboxylate transporter receptor subunit TctC
MKLLKVLAAAALAVPLGCLAQTFPDKPIRIVVPYSAGGSTDNMARVMQEPLQKALGQPVIIDNKPGASGVLAAREVIRSKPDGYTLFFVNNGNLAVTPFVQKDANYDGAKDFSPIALVSSSPMVAVVPAALPVTDLRSFVEYAKKNHVNYASAGVGSFGQLATELFANKAGLKMTHVPYKGQAPTTTAVLTNEVQLLVTTGLRGRELVRDRRPRRNADRCRCQAPRRDRQDAADPGRAAEVRELRRDPEDRDTAEARPDDDRRDRPLDARDPRQQHPR